jgi:hypothetical protein
MKPKPRTEFERFEKLTRAIVSVPKAEADSQRPKQKKAKRRRRRSA